MNLGYLLLLLLSVPFAHAQEENAVQVNITETQIALSIYLSESGRALVIGYAEESQLGSLPFLPLSKYKFNNETSELYALTDALTSKLGETWTMNFSAEGVYSDFSASFYFPLNTKISRIAVSGGLDYYISAGSESVEIAVQGFNVAAPEILVNYEQALETRRALTSLIAAGALLIAVVILVRAYKKKEEAAIVQAKKKGIAVTSEMKKVMETLSENERRIVETLISGGGKATQAKLRRETGIAKSSLSGHLNALDRKKIIKKREYGRTNIVELSPWFLGEKEQG